MKNFIQKITIKNLDKSREYFDKAEAFLRSNNKSSYTILLDARQTFENYVSKIEALNSAIDEGYGQSSYTFIIKCLPILIDYSYLDKQNLDTQITSRDLCDKLYLVISDRSREALTQMITNHFKNTFDKIEEWLNCNYHDVYTDINGI